MAIGIGNPIYSLANLPGQGKSGGGPSGPSVDLIDNNYSMLFDAASVTSFKTGIIPPAANANDFTIACWLKSSTAGVYGNYYWATACAIWTSPSQAFGILLRAPYASTDLKVCVGSSTFGSTVINDGNWHFVMAVWEHAEGAAGRISYYVDGAETPEISQNVVSYWGTVMPEPVIGDTIYPGAAYMPYDGYIDEWAWWESNQSSVSKLLYDATNDNPGKTADLSTLSTGAPTAWYRMGD